MGFRHLPQLARQPRPVLGQMPSQWLSTKFVGTQHEEFMNHLHQISGVLSVVLKVHTSDGGQSGDGAVPAMEQSPSAQK